VSRVTGVLVLPGNAPTSAAVRAIVRVRDITYSDAPAQAPVQELDLLVDLAPGARIPFSIDVPGQLLAKADRNECELNLEAHVDRDANGTFSRGDLVSMTGHPLDSNAVGTEQAVPLVLI
jgi:putative lipoprotein